MDGRYILNYIFYVCVCVSMYTRFKPKAVCIYVYNESVGVKERERE